MSLPITNESAERSVVRNRSNVCRSRSPLTAPAVKAGPMNVTSTTCTASTAANSPLPAVLAPAPPGTDELET